MSKKHSGRMILCSVKYIRIRPVKLYTYTTPFMFSHSISRPFQATVDKKTGQIEIPDFDVATRRDQFRMKKNKREARAKRKEEN